MGFLIPSHPSTNFEIQRYYQHEAKFNGVYSRNNLPKKIKDVDYWQTFSPYFPHKVCYVRNVVLTSIVQSMVVICIHGGGCGPPKISLSRAKSLVSPTGPLRWMISLV